MGTFVPNQIEFDKSYALLNENCQESKNCLLQSTQVPVQVAVQYKYSYMTIARSLLWVGVSRNGE
jgi:hypothetical protein